MTAYDFRFSPYSVPSLASLGYLSAIGTKYFLALNQLFMYVYVPKVILRSCLYKCNPHEAPAKYSKTFGNVTLNS